MRPCHAFRPTRSRPRATTVPVTLYIVIFQSWGGALEGFVLVPILLFKHIDDIFEVFVGSSVTHQLFAHDLKFCSTFWQK
jgi:hypothetical protein